MKPTYIFDLESDGLLDAITTIHSLVLLDTSTKEVFSYADSAFDNRSGSISDGLDRLASAGCLVGHNIQGFDLPAIKQLNPDWKYEGEVLDTLICSRLIWTDLKDRDWRNETRKKYEVPNNLKGRHSLESWGHRLSEAKGDFGKTTDWARWSKDMQRYCEQDVQVTAKLLETIEGKQYSEEATQLEHAFADLMRLQENQGWPFDVEGARKLYVKLQSRKIELDEKLQEVFPPTVQEMKTPAYWTAGGTQYKTKGEAKKKGHKDKDITRGPNKTKEIPFNPGSRDHIADRFKEKYQWKPKVFTDTNKVVVDESVLSKLKYPEARLLLEYLLIQKRMGQVGDGANGWIKLERDGRIHGRVNTNGAVTGRCTHSKPNVAQVPRSTSPYGEECRSLFLPEKGWKLVGVDASGLELRCLAHYMAAWDGGKYANTLVEGDIHKANQLAAGLGTRDQAKTFIYAFLYGAGDTKIGSIVGGSRVQGKQLKARFFKATPAMEKLKKKIEKTVETRGYLVGLDGRHLHIRSEHAALNTLLQSAGALVMKKACVLFKQACDAAGLEHGRDWAAHGQIHDEFQFSTSSERSEALGRLMVDCIKNAGEHFKFRCPLDGEYKIGKNWASTH